MRSSRLLVVMCLLLAACDASRFLPPPPSEQGARTSAPAFTRSSGAASSSTSESQQESVELEGADVEAQSSAGGVAGELPERLLPSGIVEVGRENAPVTLLLVTHHSCRYCAELVNDELPSIFRTFVQPGTLKLHLLPLQLEKYPESAAQTTALTCAAAQGKGWDMHQILLKQTSAQRSNIMQQATGLGADVKKFLPCLDDPRTIDLLAVQESIAESLGTTLVPTIFLNGEKLVGKHSAAELRGRVEELLRNMPPVPPSGGNDVP